jgi:hypothetical protein
MRSAITTSKLLVRINPIGDWSKEEIERAIGAGADIVMLPYFRTVKEVSEFLELVSGRIKTCLLFETMDAIASVDDILALGGIDFVHIGLNDLHIERGTTFMFEFLTDPTLEVLAEKFKKKGIPFGFGGVGRIGYKGELFLASELILGEHYRLGSSGVILSRSFCPPMQSKSLSEFEKLFIEGVYNIRQIELFLQSQDEAYFERNHLQVINEIARIVKAIKERGKNVK